LSCAVWDECIPKDPNTSLYLGLYSSSSSSLEGSSNRVEGLCICPSCTAFVAAVIASSKGLVSLGSEGPSAQDGGQVGSPLCSSNMKLIPGSGWFLSPSSFRASRKHSNLFPRTCTSNHMP